MMTRSKMLRMLLVPVTALALVLAALLAMGSGRAVADTDVAPPASGGVDALGDVSAATGIELQLRGIVTGTGAEIGAYHAGTRRMYVVTGEDVMDVLDLSNPLSPTLVMTVPVGEGGANSLAVCRDIVAVAVENENSQANGFVHFYDLDGTLVNTVTVGALPDMLTFTPDKMKIVVANEGEPSDDYTVDPEGTVSVIDVSGAFTEVTQADVTTIGFTGFTTDTLDSGVRIFGPGATVAQDLEPEYVAVSGDSTMAYVTLQENNALAIVDLTSNTVMTVTGLGFKDWMAFGNQLDPSDKDDGINLDHWPVYGMYQPDAIASYEYDGKTYLVTANEGDARDYDGFSEEDRVDDLTLDATVFSATLQNEENLGRLKTTNTLGDTDGDGEHEVIYAYGARSFSIWDADGNQVYDSAGQLGHLTAALFPTYFNANDSSPTEFDKRSDDKGTEPEGVTLGTVGGRTYAFLGLERNGGVVVYDVTDPMAPFFVQYLVAPMGSVAPEGLTFIPGSRTSTGTPWLVVNYEDSGTTAIFEITVTPRAYVLGDYTGDGAEIGAYHAGSRRQYIVTGGDAMEVLDMSNPFSPTLVMTVPVGEGGANSVAVCRDIVAVAVENEDAQANGFVHFYDLDGTLVNTVTVGALPDMLTFTPDKMKVVVANEGEPNDAYTVDPEGTVSVIDVSGLITEVEQTDVTTIDFTGFTTDTLPSSVRIFGPGATVAQDLEPEYVAVSADSKTAWVTLQENNAVAVVSLTDTKVITIAGLGFKDWMGLGLRLDPSDIDGDENDDGINMDDWPVYGMYQPDAIAAYEAGSSTYLVTANEGDGREYEFENAQGKDEISFTDEARVEDLTLDTSVFSDTLKATDQLGRLKVTDTLGDADGNGEYEALYAFGARSFSIWDAAGTQVFDSGDQLAHLTAALVPGLFNANDSSPDAFDERSDDKGNEPEGVTTGIVDGRTFAFVGLERNGAIVVYDVTDPLAPTFYQYLPPMNGAVGPEGLTFIPATKSPTGVALLVAHYEETGTTTVFQIGPNRIFLPLIAR